MNFQRRGPWDARDRRISLMPMERKSAPVMPYVGTWFLFICALVAIGNFIEWIAPQ